MSQRESVVLDLRRPRGLPRLLLWFAAGFGVTFAGMLLVMPQAAMHPSGAFVVSCRLWRYYLIEARNAFGPSAHTLGPATGGMGRLMTVALEHVVCSALGGALVAGIVWVYRKSKRKQVAQDGRC